MSITDPGVQSAAAALLEDLHSAGCTDGFDQYVADFQNAWNAATPDNPLVLRDGTPGADGYYGANTQAALQATLNASGTAQQAPTGCVAAAPGSANQTEGGGAAVVPPPAPGPSPLPAPAPTPGTNTTTTKPSGGSAVLWVVGVASAAALGATYYVHQRRKRARR